jgi:hypothetical protein
LRRWYACRSVFIRSNLPVHFSLKNLTFIRLFWSTDNRPIHLCVSPFLGFWPVLTWILLLNYLSSKFCVCVAGFLAPDPLATTLVSPYYSTPTLHVLGRNDVIVIEEWTNVLINNSTNTRVERHDGGVYSFHSSGSLSLLLIDTLLSQVTLSPLKPIGGTSSVIICLIRSGTYHLRDFPVHPPQIPVQYVPT